MKWESSFPPLLLLQPFLVVRKPEWTLTSASSMRKWLDRLITRLGAAEYWETESEGREVHVPFEIVSVVGTAPQACHRSSSASQALSQIVYDQAACLCVGLNRISSFSKSQWPHFLSEHRALMRKTAPNPINSTTLCWPCGWSEDG